MIYEKFIGKIWKAGNSVVVTIPSNYVDYAGYKEGDIVKVMIKKEVKK